MPYGTQSGRILCVWSDNWVYGVTAIIMTVTVNPKHVISGLMQSVVMIEVVFSISLTIKVLKTLVVEI